MIDLNALAMFAHVAEAGSFSEGAKRLRMPVSTVSRRIADLEHQLGIRLLERTTRGLRLTAAGRETLARAREAIELGSDVEAIASERASEPSGSLRLAAPPSLADSLLAPIIDGFQALHPRVTIDVMVTERDVDHIAEQIDLSFKIGPLRDTSLIARRVLSLRHRIVACPGYLARAEAPSHPTDLIGHRLVAFSHQRPEVHWPFSNVETGEEHLFAFVPNVGVNDFLGVASSLIGGGGIGDLSPLVRPDLIRDSRLVEVLPAWNLPTFDLSLVTPSRRHVPHATALFKDFAASTAQRLFPDLRP